VIASHPCHVCDRPPLLQELYPCLPLEENGLKDVKVGNATTSFTHSVLKPAERVYIRLSRTGSTGPEFPENERAVAGNGKDVADDHMTLHAWMTSVSRCSAAEEAR
jgi:hypothetical protein